MDAETAQGIALVEAAADVGVDHFVYTSVGNADADTGVPHFDSKYAVEQRLAQTDLPWTVIAPAYFMDNLFMPQTQEALGNGVYAVPMPKDVALQQVSVRDIGRFGAQLLRPVSGRSGRGRALAGKTGNSAPTRTRGSRSIV